MSPVAQQTPAAVAGRAASTASRPAPSGSLAGSLPASHARGARHKHTMMPECCLYFEAHCTPWRFMTWNPKALRACARSVPKEPVSGSPPWRTTLAGTLLLDASPVQAHLRGGVRGRAGMDFYVVLDRAGYRVAKRRQRLSRVGVQHKVTREDAIKWFQTKFEGVVLNKQHQY